MQTHDTDSKKQTVQSQAFAPRIDHWLLAEQATRRARVGDEGRGTDVVEVNFAVLNIGRCNSIKTALKNS